MMTGAAILQIQEEVAQRAAESNLEPYTIFSEATAFEDLRHATNLGDYVPDGWTPARFEDYADCDTTARGKLQASQDACASQFDEELILWVSTMGMGERGDFNPDELEPLAQAFCRRAAERGKTLAFAICEEGQFQLYMRGFERVS